MANKKSAILSVDLGKNGGKKNFYSIEELNNWHQTEKSQFEWLNKARQAWNPIGPIWDHVMLQLQSIREVIAKYQPSDVNAASYLERIGRHIENLYRNEALISNNTPAGIFISKLAAEDSVTAAYALGYMINVVGATTHWSSKAVKGFNEAWAFKNGLKSNLPEKEALEKSYQEWAAFLAESKDKSFQLVENFEDTLGNIKNIEAKFATEKEELFARFKEQLDQTISESDQRLKNIADAYDKHMAIQASVEYWEARQSHHKSESKKYYRVAGLVGLLGVALIIWLSYWLLGLDNIKVENNEAHLQLSDIPIWGISIVVLTTSLFVWIERILVRLILSNLHLETDAGERVVMSKTYIAMLRDGHAPKDDDRKLILASLFRPNTNGIINDDALPFNLDVMQKITGGKG